MALEMRERCERCAWPLGTDDDTAYICSYECTFCATCANALNGICPNCGGGLVGRPPRAPQATSAAPPAREQGPLGACRRGDRTRCRTSPLRLSARRAAPHAA